MSQLGNTVLLSRKEGIAHICFNRPDAFNAIDLSLAREFHAACRDVAADRQLRMSLRRATISLMTSMEFSILRPKNSSTMTR